MSEPARAFHRYTYGDYLALEQDSPIKHEYLSGEIYALAGGTPEHAALAMAVATALGRQLSSGECRLFSSDLRVRILATGLTTYPDLSIIADRWSATPKATSRPPTRASSSKSPALAPKTTTALRSSNTISAFPR